MNTPQAKTGVEVDTSFFETWYSLQSPEYGERKQLARDAYTAGAEDATASLAAERAEAVRVRRDAERYQMLRKAIHEHPGGPQALAMWLNWHPDTFKDGFDFALDAALSPSQQGEPR